jgi:hypothetical protein
MGAMKKHPLHMSLDELIEYRKTGVRPAMIIDIDTIEEMARTGSSIQTICGIFKISKETFYNNPAFLTAFNSGRANLAHRLRGAIVEDAFENNILQAKLYLDKMLGGDNETVNITATVEAKPLESVPTDNLLEIMYSEKDPSKPD